MKKLGLVCLVLGLMVMSAVPAFAQYEGGTTTTVTTTSTTQPGQTTTTQPGQTTTTQFPPTTQGPTGTTIFVSTTIPGGGGAVDLGTLFEGQVRTAAFCGFAVGSQVALSFNGLALGSKTADAAGCVTVTIEFVDDDDANTVTLGRPSLAAIGVRQIQLAQASGATVRIDGRTLAGNIGNNTVTASGIDPSGAPLSVTTSFRLASDAEQRAQFGTGSGTGARGGGGGGAIPRTGAMLLKWSAVGLVLLGIGGVLVTADRRRSRRSVTTDA